MCAGNPVLGRQRQVPGVRWPTIQLGELQWETLSKKKRKKTPHGSLTASGAHWFREADEQGSTHFYFPDAGLALLLCECWGSELRSLCLYCSSLPTEPSSQPINFQLHVLLWLLRLTQTTPFWTWQLWHFVHISRRIQSRDVWYLTVFDLPSVRESLIFY